jgi:hypothetical protein
MASIVWDRTAPFTRQAPRLHDRHDNGVDRVAVLLQFQHGPERIVFKLRVILGLDIFSSPILQVVHVQEFLTRHIHRRVIRPVRAGVNLGEIKPVFNKEDRVQGEMGVHMVDIDFHVLDHILVIPLGCLAVAA